MVVRRARRLRARARSALCRTGAPLRSDAWELVSAHRGDRARRDAVPVGRCGAATASRPSPWRTCGQGDGAV